MKGIQELPFRANGHQARIPDGDLATVYEHEDMKFIPQLGFSRCGTCGTLLMLQVTDDAVTVTTPCPYPDGITTTVTLAVPSGKVLVTDDLRPLYDWRDSNRDDPPGMADYNTALGQHQAITAMAAQGCAYGPVGNTCPELYRTGEGSYAIASLGHYAIGSDRELSTEEATPPGWTGLAGIITDLWAYSIADYGDWLSRGGDPASIRPGWSTNIVAIPPGTYEFTHHTGERSFDRDAPGTIIFAHIRRLDHVAP